MLADIKTYELPSRQILLMFAWVWIYACILACNFLWEYNTYFKYANVLEKLGDYFWKYKEIIFFYNFSEFTKT